MESTDQQRARPAKQSPAFATTHWSVVLAAGRVSSPDANAALEDLCGTYWYPLYAYARRRGCSVEDAQDQTQEFFAGLLEKEFLRTADRERGRFRSFLLTIFKRFLSKQRDRSSAQKRGGDRLRFSIDAGAGENRYQFEPADDWTPEKLYERSWALTLLEGVMTRLEEEYAGRDKSNLFETLKPHLAGSVGAPPYVECAARLEMTETAVRVAVHRMRARYRELLKTEVAQTVEGPEEVEAELKHLRAALRGE